MERYNYCLYTLKYYTFPLQSLDYKMERYHRNVWSDKDDWKTRYLNGHFIKEIGYF